MNCSIFIISEEVSMSQEALETYYYYYYYDFDTKFAGLSLSQHGVFSPSIIASLFLTSACISLEYALVVLLRSCLPVAFLPSNYNLVDSWDSFSVFVVYDCHEFYASCSRLRRIVASSFRSVGSFRCGTFAQLLSNMQNACFWSRLLVFWFGCANSPSIGAFLNIELQKHDGCRT